MYQRKSDQRIPSAIPGESKENPLFLTGMILSMFCWGISWASGKVIASYSDAFTISLFRFVLTFISLLVLLVFAKNTLRIQREGWFWLGVASLVMSLYYYLFFRGLASGKAGAGGVLVTTLNPVVSYLLMLGLNRRRPTMYETAGIVTGIIAGAILLHIWNRGSNILEAGNIYFLLASFTWAVLSQITSKSSKFGSPAGFSLWMYGICSILMIPLSDLPAAMSLVRHGDLAFWGNLFFSATITTSLATTFYFIATSRIGAGRASSFIFMVPLSAALGSWLFLGEVPESHTIAGGLIGIAAIYLLNKKR